MVWYTDRSRIVTGLQHCQMARYYKYHVRGTGVTAPPSYDQALGIAIHEGLNQLVTKVPLAAAIALARAEFSKAHLMDKETNILIGSILAAWAKVMLPKMLEDFEVVHAEEDMKVELEQDIHYMFRPDMILRRKSDGKLGVHDFKTVKAFRPDYQIDQYKKDIQMAANCIFAATVCGEPIDHYYIHLLVKGSRKPTWDDAVGDYSGPETSDSKLVYCYHQDADPPITREDWSPTFMYRDSSGKRRRLGNQYKRKLITDAGLNSEEWVEKIDDKTLYSLFPILGPYDAPDVRAVEKYTRMVVGEEVRWQNRLKSIAANPAQLDYIVPRSFDCFKWNHPCEYMSTCFAGTDLAGMTPRVPHHVLENK